ncbi:hypothetical protein V5799_021874 [Amblyomma americanum]|uniref:Uncharacterized protein n=1 Tax=Amblyomma americanum TaxID=6943 RepID=A0AAQ4FNL2_AMBAM
MIGKACFVDTGQEMVKGAIGTAPAQVQPRPGGVLPPFLRPNGSRNYAVPEGVPKPFNASNAASRFSAGGQPPPGKVFGGRSFFRGRPPVSAVNKTFEEKAYFREKPLSQRVFGGGASSRFACAVYGSTVPILLVLAVVGWYQWKNYRRRRHYRLLGSFRDTRYPAYELDPNCDDCDYKNALQHVVAS